MSASAARSTPRWRCAGARRARRSSAAAAAYDPSTSRPRGRASTARRRATAGTDDTDGRNGGFATPLDVPPPWTDRRRRTLYPLPFPEITVEPGVFMPGEPSHMTWRYLFREAIGAHQRCLDVGCGTGLLGIQLAQNGASHVLAVDIDQRAVANTLGNAFRNDVSTA